MVSKLLLLCALLIATNTPFANDKCTEGSEFEPALCPIRLPEITAIQIQENGAKAAASQDQNVDCSDFKLDAKQVQRFFSLATEADERDAHYTLDWSPCYASGTLTFADGKTAHWSINQFRTGTLAIDDVTRMFLYCPKCDFKPFQ
jgi:hypothetical protein